MNILECPDFAIKIFCTTLFFLISTSFVRLEYNPLHSLFLYFRLRTEKEVENKGSKKKEKKYKMNLTVEKAKICITSKNVHAGVALYSSLILSTVKILYRDPQNFYKNVYF